MILSKENRGAEILWTHAIFFREKRISQERRNEIRFERSSVPLSRCCPRGFSAYVARLPPAALSILAEIGGTVSFQLPP
jgi:hypothetical protein